MDETLKQLLVNLKNYPWHLYQNYKVEEVDAKKIIVALTKLEEEQKNGH